VSSLRVIVLEAEGEGVSALLEQLPAILGVRSTPSPTLHPSYSEIVQVGGSVGFREETPVVCAPVPPATPFKGDSLEADLIPEQVKRVVDDCSYYEDLFNEPEPQPPFAVEEEVPDPAIALGDLILKVNEEAHKEAVLPKSKPCKTHEGTVTPGKFSGRILSAFRIGVNTPDARLSRSVRTGIEAVVDYWGFEPPKCEDWTNRDGLVWINAARAEKGLPPHSIPIPPEKKKPTLTSSPVFERATRSMNETKRLALEGAVRAEALLRFREGKKYSEVLAQMKQKQAEWQGGGLDERSTELLVSHVHEAYINEN